MQPGDQVILGYDQYLRYKQLDNQNKQHLKTIQDHKKHIEQLKHQLQVTEEKFVIKNIKFCKEQFKTQYLKCLLNQFKNVFNISGEKIGEGFQQIKGMEESQFNLLTQTSVEINIDQRLPQSFSKMKAYQEIDKQFQTLKTLLQYCTQQWKDKNKTIQYLENLTKQPKSKSIQRSIEIKVQNEKKKLQGQNLERIRQERERMEKLRIEAQQREKQNSFNSKEIQTLRKQIESLKKVVEQNQKISSNQHSGSIKTIKSLTQKLQESQKKLMEANNQIKLMKEQAPQFTMDTKTKIISLITEYSIELKKSYNQIELSSNQKKELIKSQIGQIQHQIKKELGKIISGL